MLSNWLTNLEKIQTNTRQEKAWKQLFQSTFTKTVLASFEWKVVQKSLIELEFIQNFILLFKNSQINYFKNQMKYCSKIHFGLMQTHEALMNTFRFKFSSTLMN